MRLIHFIICLLLLSKTSCMHSRGYEFHTKNNSDYHITKSSLYSRYNYPDTTIIFKPTGIMKPHSYSITPISEPLEDIVKNTRKDTMSFFFFHADTLNKYTLEELQRGYMVLRRYDLSSQDIITLKNQYGVPEIHYPPDERMKDMKMWPPYGSECNIKKK